jgi:glycosyltransferase involved in cell wall biosynthesis
MFSVVIPLYNKEQYISRTIQSVLDQTFQDFEIVIVNDGSTDGSVAELEKFDDERIHLVHQDNAGVSAARNRGIEKAKYELIAFLDADDLWEKDFLETMVMLKNNYEKCSIFAVNYKIQAQDNSTKSIIINGLPEGFKKGILHSYFQIASQSDPILWTSSIVVKKEAIESIGGFPLGIHAGEDLLTWARLASRFDIAYTLEQKAIFCRWDAPEHNVPRTPDSHDKVGEGLRVLLTEGDQDKIVGLENYIAYWHKIRVAIFLRLDKQREVRKEFKRMSEFAEKDLKYYIYGVLVYSPKWMTKGLTSFVSNLNAYRRKII